eukprot:TRINITY_DN4944_c3_g1_i1.p1 TRINITY_DN4944_c3_g1~~TRINITY_DN4944_c3_g1_i1.p1  ORF type:complete len:172 (-),score=42.72 TRINITY_DN4944_c3_g1_i1:193-708(-)
MDAPSGDVTSNMESSSRGRDVSMLPERFLALDDVVAKELAELDYPWNIRAIEETIQEYTSLSEAISAQLSDQVMQNYNKFMQGIQQVQCVETELSLIDVLIKNGRRKLQNHDAGITCGSMQITRQHRKRERLKDLLKLLSGLGGGVVEIDGGPQEKVAMDSDGEDITHYAA